MPNYSLVANSTFQPFTYQELMLPVERQNQYFEKLAEEYDKMSSQADVLEAMGSSDLDRGSNTYNRYKAYSDNLRKERDNLFANGLNYESRQRLSDLRRAYNTEIVPIQNAWQKREQEAQLQMKARMDAAARGIDIRFSRDAANSSLDSYLQNPNQGFQVINGQQITNEVANQFKGLASQVQSDGKGNYFLKGKPLNQVEYSIITQKGMDWNHYQDFINNPNDPRWSNLKGIIDSTLNAHGIRNFDENTYNDMFRYGAQGVAAGVGARDVQFHTDRAGVMALQDYYDRLKEDRAAAREAARNNGNGNGENNLGNTGLPGETVAINFNDPESAGMSMKRRMAQATADFLSQHPNNPYTKKIMDYWKNRGGIEAAKKHWEENGFNGDEKWVGKAGDKYNLYYRLGDYLRNNVTKNEGLINIWRSGYAKESKAPQGEDSASSYRKNTYGGLDMYGNQITEADYSSTRRVPGRGTVKSVKAGTKDWGDFDKQSSNGYKVKAIELRDKQDALDKYLNRLFSRSSMNMNDKTVKLFDIEKISGDNTYTYSKGGTNIKDLPHTSSGEVDFKKMHRMMLSNGDYLLYWKDDNGKSKEKVLRRSDIGEDAVADWETSDNRFKTALALYSEGKLSKKAFEEILQRTGQTNMANAYLDTQEVDVEDYKIK